jgi:hypothetical protein
MIDWSRIWNRIFRSVDTADHKISYLKVEYLGEFESLLETALICRLGAQIELFGEKNQGSNLNVSIDMTCITLR